MYLTVLTGCVISCGECMLIARSEAVQEEEAGDRLSAQAASAAIEEKSPDYFGLASTAPAATASAAG